MEGFPNPDVYLNHLSSFESQQLEISRNIVIVILGATLWDVLVFLPDDIRIVSRSTKFSWVLFCFPISRLSGVGYVILETVARTTPINNIHTFSVTSYCLLSISGISSSYLFLKRAQAVYSGHRWSQIFLFFSWSIVVGVICLVPIGTHSAYIPGTHYYKDPGFATYVNATPWVSLMFDTIVFLAISHKIARDHGIIVNNDEEYRSGWQTFFSKRQLPHLSKAVLEGGQQHYFIAVLTTIIIAVGLCLPSDFKVVGAAFLAAKIPMVASMACRVFRNLKLLELDPQMLSLPTISSC